MKKENKLKSILGIVFPFVLLGCLIIVNVQKNQKVDLTTMGETNYMLSLNISNTPSELTTSSYSDAYGAKPSRETFWDYKQVKNVAAGHVLLRGHSQNKGYIENVSPIAGLTSIIAVVSGQPLNLYGAYDLGDTYTLINTFSVGSSSHSLIYGYPFLRFQATSSSSDTQITMLSLNYSCKAVSMSGLSIGVVEGKSPMYIGDTITLQADILPLNATNGKVTWSSSNNIVASVNDGVVSGLSIGNANITATSLTNPSLSANYVVEVIAQPVLGSISIANVSTSVNTFSNINVTYTNVPVEYRALTFAYDNNYIYISGDYASGYQVEGALASTSTSVTATTANGVETTFNITVSGEWHTRYYDDSSWTNSISVTKISNINQSFVRGIDVSEVYENTAKGAKYYNTSGVRQDVYQILKDNGVTHARIRIWNDPYIVGSTTNSYGGGICDLPRVLKMAKDAYRAGLEILLDFHYSDFWAHPDQQVVPKAWKDYTSVSQFEAAFKSYSKSVMQALLNEGVNVDIVQIGNEITSGLVNQIPTTNGASNAVTGNSNPNYITNMSWLSWSSNIVAIPWSDYTHGLTNLRKYVKAAIEGVKEVNANVQIALHLAHAFSSSTTWPRDFFTSYFGSGSGVTYDIIGLSYYPMYHGTIAQLTTALNNIKNNGILTSKKVMILENSYGFTTQNNAYLNNQFSSVSGYATSVQGQANEVRDVMNALVSSIGASKSGIFMWAGCWTPVSGVGWAGSGTVNTWANQAMFSYDGRALPSLEVFNRVY
ncbi:MAG: glycosyl hydrolase 53 family protein [Bacilli bacterium]|jgi:arabinogalactan endo-1,4-beta-galactosidase|nr:glycosyl hydrolase 53 family protein [Bacilli bacterium]NLN80911.1 hypothetical protein [Erysipelotrichia bacterium]